MGNWIIVISGTGAHHNEDNPKDANVLAEEYVKDLKAKGQTVHYATFIQADSGKHEELI